MGVKCSSEAYAARSAFLAVEGELTNLLLQCGSGKELIERGYKDDVYLASELNVSDCAPVLQDGAYVAQ